MTGTTRRDGGRLAGLGARVAFAPMLVLLTCTPAAAQQGWKMYGPGAQTCSAFLQGSPALKQDFASWALGFLSGANFFTTATDVIGRTTQQQVAGFVDGFCRQNPDVPFGEAARELFIALARPGEGQ